MYSLRNSTSCLEVHKIFKTFKTFSLKSSKKSTMASSTMAPVPLSLVQALEDDLNKTKNNKTEENMLLESVVENSEQEHVMYWAPPRGLEGLFSNIALNHGLFFAFYITSGFVLFLAFTVPWYYPLVGYIAVLTAIMLGFIYLNALVCFGYTVITNLRIVTIMPTKKFIYKPRMSASVYFKNSLETLYHHRTMCLGHSKTGPIYTNKFAYISKQKNQKKGSGYIRGTNNSCSFSVPDIDQLESIVMQIAEDYTRRWSNDVFDEKEYATNEYNPGYGVGIFAILLGCALIVGASFAVYFGRYFDAILLSMMWPFVLLAGRYYIVVQYEYHQALQNKLRYNLLVFKPKPQ